MLHHALVHGADWEELLEKKNLKIMKEDNAGNVKFNFENSNRCKGLGSVLLPLGLAGRFFGV